MIRKLEPSELFSVKGENVVCFEVRNGTCIMLATLERWEDCPVQFQNDPYRLNVYHHGWEIPEDRILDSACETAGQEGGYRCGGIDFYHEEDRDEDQTAIEFLYHGFPGAQLLEMRGESFKKVLPTLQDGIYIVREYGPFTTLPGPENAAEDESDEEDVPEDILYFREVAYRRYQLCWMLDHGWNIEKFMQCLYAAGCINGTYFTDGLDTDSWILAVETIRNFEQNSGFNGELWACKDEFLECEYRDREYMKRLITFPDEQRVYGEDMRRAS